jgi:hypothetical protein
VAGSFLSKNGFAFSILYPVIVVWMVLSNYSCKNTSNPEGDVIVAKAFDKTLSQTDIASLFGPDMTRQDSFLVAKGYIDHWIQKEVILHYAKKSDIKVSEEINKKVEDFKGDLLTFEYRKKLLYQKLDTNITLKETKDYYLQHPENFELKQNIIRFVFIKMPIALESKYKFWNKFAKANPDELSDMAMLALKNGGNAYLENEKWLAFDDILKVVPINTYNQENFINNNRLFKIDDSGFVWYIKITDFRIKDNISPFEFVEDKIHEILINKRKMLMMEKLENEMVLKAVKDNQIKIYMPQYE